MNNIWDSNNRGVSVESKRGDNRPRANQETSANGRTSDTSTLRAARTRSKINMQIPVATARMGVAWDCLGKMYKTNEK